MLELCQQANRPDTLIRIVCHELESWFLGDLAAVEQGLNIRPGKLSKLQNNKKYRNPDNIAAAKQESKKITSTYQQISSSKEIAKHLNINNNKSHSFNVFIQGLKRLLSEPTNIDR